MFSHSVLQQVALIEGLLLSASRHSGCPVPESSDGKEQHEEHAADSKDDQAVQVATVDSFQVAIINLYSCTGHARHAQKAQLGAYRHN